MRKRFYFNQVIHTPILVPLKEAWRESLTAPQDGMWEGFMEQAIHWEIRIDNQIIGYACVNDNNHLIQFYITPSWVSEGVDVLKQFINQERITEAVVGTNNPIFLSMSMHLQKEVSVNTYLFKDFKETSTPKAPGLLKLAWKEDLDRLVNFYHINLKAPVLWLTEYLGNLIERGELFSLEKGSEVLGTCEVRSSESNPKVADIGMVVSVDHRRKGIGTFLLGKAKELAYDLNRTPICSCEKDNIGSLKSIYKNGFCNIDSMLSVKFV